MNLKVLTPHEWTEIGEKAHLDCFNEKRNPSMNRIDQALLITNDQDELICYSTIIELDEKSAYMQHGGAFSKFSGTTYVARGYHLMIAFLKEKYSKISTRILNKNVAMIKLALSAELIPSGVDLVDGDLFLNLLWCRA